MIDGPAAVLAGDHDHQVAFVGLALLVPLPAAGPGEMEIGLPAEGQLAHQDLAGHAGRRDHLRIVGQEIIAQGLQVAVMMLQPLAGLRVEHAVGVVLVRERPAASLAIVCQ